MLKAVEGRGLRAIIHFFSFIIVVAVFFNAGVGLVFAQAIGTGTRDEAVPDTCDADFMKSLEARSWMEGEREGIQNQSLIVKPDSILGMACLGSWLANTAYDRGFFSEGLGSESMDDALSNLVQKSLWRYFKSSFQTQHLGGRSEFRWFFDTEVTAARYNCPQLNRGYDHDLQRSVVGRGFWSLSKCYNFQPDDQPQDGFFTFKDYVSGAVPSAPSGEYYLDACEKDERWETMYKLALDEPPWWPSDWATQSRPNYYDLLDPSACTGAVPTGITVKLADGSAFPDAVCSAPGCWYDGGGCN